MSKIKYISLLWVILLFSAFLSCYLLFSLHQSISHERNTRKNYLEMIKMGYQLEERSNYLTSKARAFAVTANPKALQAYWHEVNIDKNREYTIERLKQLSAKQEEINLLAQSKHNSDDLINTEVQSMKLVLDAYQVPPSKMPIAVKNYILSKKDKKLSKEDKILLAQKIMFDEQYLINKNKIMVPAEKFKSDLEARVIREMNNDRKKVNLLLNALITCITFIMIFTVMIIWIRMSLSND